MLRLVGRVLEVRVEVERAIDWLAEVRALLMSIV